VQASFESGDNPLYLAAVTAREDGNAARWFVPQPVEKIGTRMRRSRSFPRHAGVQQQMYPGLSPLVRVHAPLGPDLIDYLGRIARYNGRPQVATDWRLDVQARLRVIRGERWRDDYTVSDQAARKGDGSFRSIPWFG
jgi:hypothetical protein